MLGVLQEHLPEQASVIIDGILGGIFDVQLSAALFRDYFSSETK